MADDISRRQFLGTGIALGWALAAGPLRAAAILTSGDGLSEGAVEILTGGQKMPAYRAMPKGKTGLPTVIVIQEIFGVHAYIQDVCRRLAKEGYLAIAPSLYFRQGDATKISDVSQLISQIVSKVPQGQVLTDLDATLAWAEKNGGDGKRLAVTGFCWGGNKTWMYAAHNPKLKAAVAWYGPLAGEPKPDIQPNFPLDIAPALKTPVLGLYGGKDAHIGADQIQKMRAALKKGTSRSDIVVYPDADHGFHADYRPSYNEQAAKDGWTRMLGWFAAHGMKS